MMLALSETRLLFHPEGLAETAWAVALAGTAIAALLLGHWLLGRLRGRKTEPILPGWQMAVGLALALGVALAARAAGGRGTAALVLLMAAIAASCTAWVLFFYLRLFTYLGRMPMAVLIVLRVLAILILVLLIFKPTWSYEERLERRTDLCILVDSSRSMSVSDYPDTPNRMAMAVRQVQQYLGRLETAFDLKLYSFDTHAEAVQGNPWPDPTGDATNLSRSIKDVLAAADRPKTTALIVMSDGLHNSGGSVPDEVAALGPPPVYAVGIGTDLTATSGYQDIALENIRAPEEATANNLTRLVAEVSAVGLADRSVRVELREIQNTAPLTRPPATLSPQRGGEGRGEGESTVLASEPLRLASRPGVQTVTLSFTPTTTGRHTYTVRIPPDPAERRTENNERAVHMLVVDPKIRVLYIENARPEYKPLKESLESDPNVELLALVQVKRGEFLQSGNMTGLKLAGFPQTPEDMRKFDVFILGDLDRSYLSAAQMANLKAAVAEGRGLLAIGGSNSFGPGGYEGTAVEETLPVAVGPRTMGQETTPFILRLTPEGLNHPIFTGTRDFFSYQAQTPKEKLPLLLGCNVLGLPKPGASVLAVHPERRTDAGAPLPVLVVHAYGKGRAAAFAADTTFRWYLPFRALGRESPYTRFWGQMVRWLASKEIVPQSTEPGVTVVLAKPFYNPGEKITVKARVRAEEGRATHLATVTGLLMDAGGKRKDLALALSAGGGGEYVTVLDPPDPGTYRLIVEARKDGKRLGADETEVVVGRPNQEFERLGIDRGLLKKLAQATGGEFYEPANFGDLVERLRSASLREDMHRELGVQTVPGLFGILFGAFLVLVTGEWLLRKYYQLA
jgi:uncharacterized membrane protein